MNDYCDVHGWYRDQTTCPSCLGGERGNTNPVNEAICRILETVVNISDQLTETNKRLKSIEEKVAP